MEPPFLRLILAVLTCYGVTEIITMSYIAKGFRAGYREFVWEIAPDWISYHAVRWFVDDEGEEKPILTDEAETTYDGREIKGYDQISCAICTGFWVALIVSISFRCEWWFLAVYGGAVFLNRQER